MKKSVVADVSNTTYSIVETQFDPLGRTYRVSNPHNSTDASIFGGPADT